jgi:hypothetical protein
LPIQRITNEATARDGGENCVPGRAISGNEFASVP